MCLDSVAYISKVVFDQIYKRKLSLHHLFIIQCLEKKSKDKFRGIHSWDKSREKQQEQSEIASEACSSSAILWSAGPEADDGLQGTVEENVPPTASERKLMGSVEATGSDVVEGKGSKEYDSSKPYYVEDPGYRFFQLSNVYQAFQDSHKCKMPKSSSTKIKLDVMVKVPCFPWNVPVAERKPTFQHPSPQVTIGILMIPLISTGVWCMLLQKLASAEKVCLQYVAY